jgi:hypothetical protein
MNGMPEANPAGAGPSSDTPARRPFPGLDPEPPRDPWRAIRRSMIPLAVVLAVGLGSLVYAHHNGAAPRPAGTVAPAATSIAPGFSGVVLAQLHGGALSLTEMSTGQAVVLKSLGDFGTIGPEQISPDGKYLVDPDSSRVISFASLAHPAAVSNGLTFPAPGSAQPEAYQVYWSDHDARIFLATYPDTGQVFPKGAVESVRTGRSSAVQHFDGATGDPQAAGAFVAVPGIKRPPPPQEGAAPDTSITLDDVGRPARLLATAATLARAAGLKPGTHVTLNPTPNPQGTMVAVTVFPAASNSGQAGGIVVLSRSGKVLGTEVSGQFEVAWSPSGRSLVTIGPGPADLLTLTRWQVGGPKAASTLDINEEDLTSCMWSPDGTAVLCGGAQRRWTLLRAGRPAVIFTGDGQPLAWLNGRVG